MNIGVHVYFSSRGFSGNRPRVGVPDVANFSLSVEGTSKLLFTVVGNLFLSTLPG